MILKLFVDQKVNINCCSLLYADCILGLFNNNHRSLPWFIEMAQQHNKYPGYIIKWNKWNTMPIGNEGLMEVRTKTPRICLFAMITLNT